MLAAMRTRGVSISLCEGFGVRPNSDVSEYAPDLDILCELEVRRINVASSDRTGELPLLDILAALPPQLVLGIEVPQRSLADAGVGPYERVARCVEATRNLLDRLKADAPGV
jgi:hypothetical protein